MKIGTEKTEVLRLSRKPKQCKLQVRGIKMQQVRKFRYLEVLFTSDGRSNKEIDTRFGTAKCSFA